MTYDKPLQSAYFANNELYETCVWIGCEAAKGKSSEADVFNTIWNKFHSLNIFSKDNVQLGYYSGDSIEMGENEYTTTDYILQHKDGRCGSWAELFQKVMGSQGIYSGICHFMMKGYDSVIFWDSDNEYYYKTINGIRYKVFLIQDFEKFQKNGNPESVSFIDHAINTYINNNIKYYYDVTGKYNPIDYYYDTYINIYIKVKYVPLNDSPNNVLPINLFTSDIIVISNY